MNSSEIKGRISHSVLWLVWGKTGIQIVSLLSTLLIARILDPSDFGVMALAGIWVSIIIALSELGLGAAIIQFPDLKKEELNACFWLTLFLSLLCYGVLYSLAPLLGDWFNSPRLPLVLRVIGISFPLVALGMVPESLLRKELLLNRVSQAEIIASLFTIPVMLGLAFYGAGVWALVSGSVLRPLLQSGIVFWYRPWIPGFNFYTKRLQNILKFSFHTLGSNFLWVAMAQIDVFLLGRMASESSVGVYSIAKELALLPVSKIGVVVNQVSRPMLALLQDDAQKTVSSFLEGIKLVNIITLPVCAGLALIAEDAIQIGLGEKWLPSVPILQALCFYGVVRSFNLFLPPVLMAKYQTQFLFYYSLLRLVFMFFALWFGTKLFSTVLNLDLGFAMGLSWACFYPLVSSVIVRKTMRELGIGFNEIFRAFLPAISATCFMIVVGLLVKAGLDRVLLYEDMGSVVAIIKLLAVIGLCGIAYLISLTFQFRQGFSDVLRILELVLGSKNAERVDSYFKKILKKSQKS